MSSLRAIRATHLPRLSLPLPSVRLFTSTPLLLKDPWPLPLDPVTVSKEKYVPERLSDDPESWAMPQPLDRKGESEETLRARLVYQTRKRGCLEGDLLLATFARDRLKGMGVDEMREFDKVCCCAYIGWGEEGMMEEGVWEVPEREGYGWYG